MTQTKNTIDSRKRKHLSYAERSQIAILKKEGYSNRQVAIALDRAPQTIHNEIRRGTVTQLRRQKQNGKVYDYYHSVYDADAGQAFYENQQIGRASCRAILLFTVMANCVFNNTYYCNK